MSKLLKIILVGLLTIFAFNTGVLAKDIEVFLDGIGSGTTHFSIVSEKGNAMMPVREICEAAGFEVLWQSAENAAVIRADVSGNIDTDLAEYVYSVLKKTAQDNTLIPDCMMLALYLDSSDAMLYYNYKDNNGETVSYGKKIIISENAQRIQNGSLYAPLRSVLNNLGLWVSYDDNMINVSIPEFINYPRDLKISETFEPHTDDGMIYLGNFKITHYCACEKCCGIYAGQTAWGGALTPGYTIAVDPGVIDKLSDVYIDGYGLRVAEDCGGAIKGNRIDIAVSSHSEALALGVTYKDVWLVD